MLGYLYANTNIVGRPLDYRLRTFNQIVHTCCCRCHLLSQDFGLMIDFVDALRNICQDAVHVLFQLSGFVLALGDALRGTAKILGKAMRFALNLLYIQFKLF